MRSTGLFILLLLFLGCSSQVRFIAIDESYKPSAKPDDARIVFKKSSIQRPHQVIGLIEAHLGRRAGRSELNGLMISKAREVGADGVMLVEYNVDRDRYVSRHHKVVGRGRFRHHVVKDRVSTEVTKTATGLAVVFR